MLKLLLGAVLVGLVYSAGPGKCYVKAAFEYTVDMKIDYAEEDCAESHCYVMDFTRETKKYRQYGCTNAALGQACPTVNKSRRRRNTATCTLGVGYEPAEVAMGEHTLVCANNYKFDDVAKSKKVYCYNGVNWDEKYFNNDNTKAVQAKCEKDGDKWTDDLTLTDATLKVTKNSMDVALNVRVSYCVGDILKIECADENLYEASGFPLEVKVVAGSGAAATWAKVTDDSAFIDFASLECAKKTGELTLNTLVIDQDHLVAHLNGEAQDYKAGKQYIVGNQLTFTCSPADQYQVTAVTLTLEAVAGSGTAVWKDATKKETADPEVVLSTLGCEGKAEYALNTNGWVEVLPSKYVLTNVEDPAIQSGMLPGYVKENINFACKTGYKFTPSTEDGVFKYVAYVASPTEVAAHYTNSNDVKREGSFVLECELDEQNAMEWTQPLITALFDNKQRLLEGSSDIAVGTILTEADQLKLACLENYQVPNNVGKWGTEKEVDLTFVAGDSASVKASLTGGSNNAYTTYEACTPVMCKTSLLNAFTVYDGVQSSTAITGDVALDVKVIVGCKALDHAAEPVEGVELQAYQCGADGTFGALYYGCTEYKDCTTTINCTESLCNSGYALYPTLLLLLAAATTTSYSLL